MWYAHTSINTQYGFHICMLKSFQKLSKMILLKLFYPISTLSFAKPALSIFWFSYVLANSVSREFMTGPLAITFSILYQCYSYLSCLCSYKGALMTIISLICQQGATHVHDPPPKWKMWNGKSENFILSLQYRE